MKIHQKIILIIFIVSLTSCTKIFNYNLEDENLIAVGCFLKANDTVKVNLSFTKNVSYDFEVIENAEVFIYEEDKFKEKLTHTKEGEYKSLNFIPQTEKNYTLKVKVPDYDTVFASTYTPKIVKLDTITHFFVQEIDTDGETNNWEYAYLRFLDNETEKNYYIYSDFSFTYGTFSTDKIFKDLIEKKWADWNNAAYFNDDLINGETYNLSLMYNYAGYPPDTINLIFDFGSISKEMYLYLKSSTDQVYNYQQELNYFTEPIPVYSNIENGTGIFAGYSTIKYERTFVKPSEK